MVISNKRGGKGMYYAEYASPVGKLLLLSDGISLTHVLMDAAVPEGAVPGEEVAVWGQNERSGCGSGGGEESHQHSDPLPPCGGSEGTDDRLCLGCGEEGLAAAA